MPETFEPRRGEPCVEVLGRDIHNCENNPVDMQPLYTNRGLVAKIPVVLAQFRVRVPIDTIITLPERALEIKQIQKRLKVTQCLLLQDTNTLFIKGFIRKNIDYATRTCLNAQGICGDIRHCTVDVPFKCTTPVSYNANVFPEPIRPNESQEFEYFKRQKLHGPDFAEKDELMSGDFSEYNQISREYFAELPFCELISSRIVEFDEYLDRQPCPSGGPFEEKEFEKIEQKMSLEFEVKVLQTRQVFLPRTLVASSGHVRRSGWGALPGVTIEFTKAYGPGPVPPPTVTNQNGDWSQSGFAVGTTYQATPRLKDYHFNPAYRIFNGGDTGIDFTGIPIGGGGIL